MTDEHAHAIAEVCVRSALLDFMIEHLLASLLSRSGFAEALVKREGNQSQQLHYIKAILFDRYPGHRDEVESFIKEVDAARKERHAIVHYVWGKPTDGGAMHMSHYRPFRELKQRTMTAQEVFKVAEDLLQCTKNIATIVSCLDDENLAAILEGPKQSRAWPLTKLKQHLKELGTDFDGLFGRWAPVEE